MTTAPNTPRIRMPDALYGATPFYNQPNYAEAAKADFSQDSPSFSNDYVWDSEGAIARGARRACTVFSPYLIATGTHTVAGNLFFLPSSFPAKRRREEIKERRNNIDFNSEWKYRRISILVNGCKIDGAILGKESTLGNRRWMVVANGNNSRYETALYNYNESSDIKKILTGINYNGLVFSYPAVGSSQGFAGKKAMVNAHSAMLSFTLDPKDGIGATDVIVCGYSTGGGIQGEVLSTSIPPQVKLAIKDRSFSSFSDVAMEKGQCAKTMAKYTVKGLGWDIQTLNSSKELPIPEIVMQTIQSNTCEVLTSPDQVIDDGKIPAGAALATKLLSTAQVPKAEKVFLGLPEKHADKLSDASIQQLTGHINRLLTASTQHNVSRSLLRKGGLLQKVV